jgi:cytochrome b pre-mRNA-processing protein 3
MLNTLKRNKERRRLAARLHEALVARAREPVFFVTFAVEDTLDGRFDLVTLHAWLILDALERAGEGQLAQAFVDEVFIGFDEALRELGAGDIGMGRRVKKMADAFYGRMQAYGAATGEGALQEALVRNIHRGRAPGNIAALAAYVSAARAHLAASALRRGDVDFGPLPESA